LTLRRRWLILSERLLNKENKSFHEWGEFGKR
jgi:hypothetical protein